MKNLNDHSDLNDPGPDFSVTRLNYMVARATTRQEWEKAYDYANMALSLESTKVCAPNGPGDSLQLCIINSFCAMLQKIVNNFRMIDRLTNDLKSLEA